MTKHFFIVNPAAGKGSESEPEIEKILDACEVAGVCAEVHRTTGPCDATEFVRAQIKDKLPGDDYRFYACGGDGTLSEVVAGAVDPALRAPIPGVHVGCMPIGTGNDFIRNFTLPEFFRDVTKQLLADPVTIDCFALDERIGINMVNIGFDCDVVCKTAELKRNPLIPKSLAYIVGVIIVLRKNLGKKITVIRSDGSELTREFELVSVANGGFCGGGFHSAPESLLDDGLLDISLIKKVSRLTFLRLVGSYKKGLHLNTRLGRKVVAYSQDSEIRFVFDEETRVCIDGEILTLKEATFRVIPNSLSFLIPVGVEYTPKPQRRFRHKKD